MTPPTAAATSAPSRTNAASAPSPAAAAPNTNSTEALVQSAIAEISHIATLPEVTLKIIKLVEDPESTAQDLNKVISNDPALGARILKVVNSAFYGLPGQIGSINRAIVLLGLNAVKNIAIAASLAKLFRGGQICPNFTARDLWTHSIAVATGTRLLANKAGLNLPDEAFLAGLIHDIGILVEVQARRAKFVQTIEMLEVNKDMKFREVESMVVGANHEQFGSALCKAWKFPLSFVYVTGTHHHPEDAPPANRHLCGLVHVADVIAGRGKIGYARTIESFDLSTNLLESLKLSPEAVEEISKELPEAIKDASAMFQEVVV